MISILNGSVVGPGKLELLYRVLDESFTEVIAARPASDPGTEQDIRACLAQAILEAVDQGVTDPEELKQIAVRSFAPKPEDIG